MLFFTMNRGEDNRKFRKHRKNQQKNRLVAAEDYLTLTIKINNKLNTNVYILH